MLNISWLDELTTMIPSHYVQSNLESYGSVIHKSIPEVASGGVLLLKREGAEDGNFKTVLIASVNSVKESGAVIHWAANIRDMTPEPHSSDIYLFLNIKNASLEDCNRIEADELYCRKYVIRPHEGLQNFISRTFLALPMSSSDIKELSDPISASLSRTAEKHQWLSHEKQIAWRQILLSQDSAQDIIDELFCIDTRD
ncbi:ABC-three component system middle component 1 [Photobacterium leiognathi]|uniref:ABC-three component system middle component 1 n=1 Tax=Photobacterium leiognathi TaxID=553611 RepID=UPI00273977A8|nr:ABC-three component system middle component 1 [Photobacterium leiognathi]